MSQVSDALLAAVAVVQNDALITALPILNGFLTNIQQNPSQENLIAQGLLVEPQLIAAFPNFEAKAVKDLAAQIQTLMNAQAQALMTAITAPAATVSSVASEPATPTPVEAAVGQSGA